jgi:hypothetical protein
MLKPGRDLIGVAVAHDDRQPGDDEGFRHALMQEEV